MKVYVVHAVSESGDHYLAAFANKPTQKEAVTIMGIKDEFDFGEDDEYDETCIGGIDIEKCEVL